MTKGIRKVWTSIVLDADERAYVETRAASERVSLAQVVRWCVRLAMNREAVVITATQERSDNAA